MERVDFYVIDGTDARERWRFYRDRGYPMHRHDLSNEATRAP